MRINRQLFIGYDANEKPIYLTPDERKLHMHVIGSSGSGKSKFLEHMIRGDVKNRQGLCLIDPHGTLYDDIVQWLSYHNLLNRNIILLNPSQGDYVTGFNPFAHADTEEYISERVEYQITATIRAWGLQSTDETPRLEKWLGCVYQTLNEQKETIVAADYLIDYHEPEVRAYLTENLSERMSRSDWKSISSARTAEKFYDQIESTRNKLRRFLCAPKIRRFMGLREHNINVREIMDEGKILLVNLSAKGGFSHNNARLFGALLVNEFFQEAKRREGDEWGNTPKPFYLYIDEFQEFVSDDIAHILDQTRKFGLHLILAHQRLGHMREKYPDVLDTVLTNVKTRAVFGGLRRQDAVEMVEEMFVNQLDLKEVKKAIYQTKFWPKYGRDKVYGKSHSHTDMNSMNWARATGRSRQDTFAGGEHWFGIGDSSVNTEGGGSGTADATSESEVDIPIFIPVPFEELSSMEYWSRDDQIWRMSDALKAQFQRHCFIQIPARRTQPMLVPLVKAFRIYPKRVLKYQHKLYGQAKALPTAEVDGLLSAERERLKAAAMEYIASGDEPSETEKVSRTVDQEPVEETQKVDKDIDSFLR